MATDSDSEKSSTFRCLDAARYVLALVVTALIVAVTVKAIMVVLRPDLLSISVIGGSVFSAQPPPAKAVSLDVHLRFFNPSGRVRMYYTDIIVYLFGNGTPVTSSDPFNDSFVAFQMQPDKAVAQLTMVDAHLQVNPKPGDIVEPYFTMLRGGGFVSGVTMRIQGNLITEVRSGLNRTRFKTYYCPSLVVGGDPNDKALNNRQDVSCSVLQEGQVLQ